MVGILGRRGRWKADQSQARWNEAADWRTLRAVLFFFSSGERWMLFFGVAAASWAPVVIAISGVACILAGLSGLVSPSLGELQHEFSASLHDSCLQ